MRKSFGRSDTQSFLGASFKDHAADHSPIWDYYKKHIFDSEAV